jgi:hypothetical protein
MGDLIERLLSGYVGDLLAASHEWAHIKSCRIMTWTVVRKTGAAAALDAKDAEIARLRDDRQNDWKTQTT